jgi:hypothetical protein
MREARKIHLPRKTKEQPVSGDSVTKVEAAISELVAAFPATFTLDPTLVRPVKLGIKNDLYGQSAMSHRRITAALRAYCNSAQYLQVSIEGAVRIDLAGEPSGAVTGPEAHHARESLAKSNAKGTRKIAGSYALACEADASDVLPVIEDVVVVHADHPHGQHWRAPSADKAFGEWCEDNGFGKMLPVSGQLSMTSNSLRVRQ